MGLNKYKRKLLLLSAATCAFLVILLDVVFVGNAKKENEAKLLPVFYYENHNSDDNISKAYLIDERGETELAEPYIRTFSKAVPQSAILFFGESEEQVMLDSGYLLSFYNVEEGRIGVFDESFSNRNSKSFCIKRENKVLARINYCNNEYYIKTVPENGLIRLYTYELNDNNATPRTFLNCYIVEALGSVEKHILDLSAGISMENLNPNSIMYSDSNWYYSASVNIDNYLFIHDGTNVSKQIKWDGSIVSSFLDGDSLYVLSTKEYESRVTKLSIYGEHEEQISCRKNDSNSFILERSVYVDNDRLYFFVISKDDIELVETGLNDGDITSKRYNMRTDDVLMDVVLIDAANSYDLVPNIDRRNE